MNPKLLFLGKPDEKDFHLLAQIMGVSPSGLEPLKQTAQVIEVAPGSQIYSHGKRYHDAMLLLAGSLESIDPDGTRHPIEAGQHTAGILPASQPASGQCISLTSARLFKADRAFLLALCHDKSLNTLTATTGSLEDFVANLRRVMITGHIEIPTLPDIGVKIARQIEDPKVDTLSLSRLIQMDPGLAGRIIQIANSPLFGGHGRIENLYDAVARLGRNTLRDVVTGIVLKNVFRTHDKDFRQRLKE
ncbi:MAG: HDOD domain-containing protein, partial [Pseudomonadota bacterium]